jgi:iron complex transport system substrate-binding protein
MPEHRDADALNRITSTIVTMAIDIHRTFGPGLFESTYLACLLHDLTGAGHRVERQKAIPLEYRGVRLDVAYRADILVDGVVLIEVKAIDAVAPIHLRQLRTYLRLARCPVGLLLNFGAGTMVAGIKRVVNDFPDR